MLIWINGPFGGGKTQTAYELQRRLRDSVVCDPERVGFGLHAMLPKPLRADFQDLPAWRQGVFEVLDLTLRRHEGTVLAPMTVIEPAYFAETVGRLRQAGHDVRHFALMATRDTVLRRLRERGLWHRAQRLAGHEAPLRGESFALAKLDLALERLRAPEFAEQLWTDEISVAEVADRIAVATGLTLAANTDGPLRGRARRAWTGARHLRLI